MEKSTKKKIAIGVGVAILVFFGVKVIGKQKGFTPAELKSWYDPTTGEERNSHISAINPDGTISNKYWPGSVGTRTSENRIDWVLTNGQTGYWLAK